jgi:hypothetical protein
MTEHHATPASEPSAAEWQRRLKEKDATIATLSEHLERAALSLKAAKKNGAAGGGGIAFPPEVVSRQQALGEKLHRVVDEWRGLDGAGRIERFSGEMAELRQTVLRWLRPAGQPEGDAGSTGSHGSYGSYGGGAAQRGGEKPSEGSVLEGWEALKASMLGQAGAAPAETTAEEEDVDLAEELEVLANRPEPPDPHDADHATWQAAADAREKYVISLIRTLRVVEARRRGTVDWNALEGAADPLRRKVAELETALQQKLRSGEVELSMERARLGRKESTLLQREQQLEKARKRRDMTGDDNTEGQSRRWLRFLGRPNRGDG